jgi:hypothetical protein
MTKEKHEPQKEVVDDVDDHDEQARLRAAGHGEVAAQAHPPALRGARGGAPRWRGEADRRDDVR